MIIDEIGFMPTDEEADNFFFQVINDLYEKAATRMTTKNDGPLSKSNTKILTI
ncbi:ATP-binding protein [Weissella confusa]|uniref:ATP-binding protein n=1 Tax=Weissella confusa TaxID=1583 RepID=UPI003A523512